MLLDNKNKIIYDIPKQVFLVFSLILYLIIISNITPISSLAINDSNMTNTTNETDTTPPVIIIQSPDNKVYNTTIIQLSFTVFDDNSFQCYYELDGVLEQIQGCENTTNTTITTDMQTSEGSHYVTITAVDIYNNTASESVNFSVDTTPPTIEETSPSGVITTSIVDLEVTTNEDAICKLDTSDKDFEDMNQVFEHTNSITHKQQLNLDQGDYRYYVRCKDLVGNAMQSSVEIDFEVNLPPTATISIDSPKQDDTFILSQGTYKVEVVTSEPVNQPSLLYGFNDEAVSHNIALIGDNTHWTGYLMIGNIGEKIGSFYFTATDYQGLETKNKVIGLFMVDTKPPEKVSGVSYNLSKDVATLKWNALDDTVKYRVYRSTTNGVSKADFYEEVTTNKFVDELEQGIVYYYRVSGVDSAGNEGELSNEIHIRLGQVADNSISPEMAVAINTTVRQIDSLLLDIDWAITRLEDINDETIQKTIKSLDLLAKARSARNNVADLQEQVKGLYTTSLDDNQLMDALKTSLKKADAYKKQVAVNVDIKSKLDFKQEISRPELSLVAIEFAKHYGLDDNQRSALEDKSLGLLGDVDIFTEAVLVDTKYLDDTQQEKLLVFKDIQSTRVLDNVFVVEYIPKSIALKATDVSFRQPPKVLNDDPIVYWPESSLLNHQISYITSSDDIDSIHNSKTLVLLNPVALINNTKESNTTKVSGFSIKNISLPITTKNLFFALGIIILIGLFLYYIQLKPVEKSENIDKGISVSPYDKYTHRPQGSSRALNQKPNFMHTQIAKRDITSITPRNVVNPVVKSKKTRIKGAKGTASIGNPYDVSTYDINYDINTLNIVLRKAHYLANNLDLNAKNLYNKLLDSVQFVNQLPLDKRLLIEKSINELYNKIIVIEKVIKAHECVDANNVVGLKYVLGELSNALIIIEDSDFIASLNRILDYFYNIANSKDLLLKDGLGGSDA